MLSAPAAPVSAPARRPRHGLLLAPAHLVTDDPVTVYRLVVVVGSLAAAGAFPLAYLMLRRLAVGARPALAPALAAGAAALPLRFRRPAPGGAGRPTPLPGWGRARHAGPERGPERAGPGAGAVPG